jgi:hypothetical protein
MEVSEFERPKTLLAKRIDVDASFVNGLGEGGGGEREKRHPPHPRRDEDPSHR